MSFFNSITYLFLPVPVTSPIFLSLYLCFYHQTLTPHYLYFVSTFLPLLLSNSYSYLSFLNLSLYPHTSLIIKLLLLSIFTLSISLPSFYHQTYSLLSLSISLPSYLLDSCALQSLLYPSPYPHTSFTSVFFTLTLSLPSLAAQPSRMLSCDRGGVAETDPARADYKASRVRARG